MPEGIYSLFKGVFPIPQENSSKEMGQIQWKIIGVIHTYIHTMSTQFTAIHTSTVVTDGSLYK